MLFLPTRLYTGGQFKTFSRSRTSLRGGQRCCGRSVEKAVIFTARSGSLSRAPDTRWSSKIRTDRHAWRNSRILRLSINALFRCSSNSSSMAGWIADHRGRNCARSKLRGSRRPSETASHATSSRFSPVRPEPFDSVRAEPVEQRSNLARIVHGSTSSPRTESPEDANVTKSNQGCGSSTWMVLRR